MLFKLLLKPLLTTQPKLAYIYKFYNQSIYKLSIILHSIFMVTLILKIFGIIPSYSLYIISINEIILILINVQLWING